MGNSTNAKEPNGKMLLPCILQLNPDIREAVLKYYNKNQLIKMSTILVVILIC